jgi:peroxiredoxin
MKILKEAFISFLIGVVLAFFVSVFRAFQIDYFKIPAHAIIYSLAGFLVYKHGKRKSLTGLFIFLPSVLILIFASFANFNAIYKWIVELINLSISFGLGYYFASSSPERKPYIAISWITFTLLTAFFINPKLVYSTQFRYKESRELINSKTFYNLKSPSGNSINSDSLRGKTVLLDFWFANCRPCITKMKALSKLSVHYKNTDDVIIVAVNNGAIDTSFAQFQNITKKLPAGVVYAYDQLGFLNAELQVSGYPTEFIIDKDGTIRDQFIGYNRDVDIVYLKETIAKIEKIRTGK